MKRILLTLTLVLFITPIAKAQDFPSHIPTEGLVAYYPFNGNANDESGNGNNGTVNGAALTNDRDGNENSAYYFNVNASGGWGSAQNRITISSPTISNENSFTISAWINLETKPIPFDNRPHTIMGRWDGNGVAVFRHQINYSGEISTNLRAGTNSNIVEGGSVTYGEWYHIVITYNGSILKQYINNQLTKQEQLDIDINTSSTDLTFGELHMANGHWYLFSGKMDDLGYWNRALTEQEIQNLFTSSSGDILLNGTVSAEDHQIKNVADPTDAQDAVTLSLLQTKLNELIERIEVLESNANYDCGLAYFEDFSSCDLNGYYAQGGNITSTNSSFDGCGVYMTHYAGQDPNNFYAVDKKFLYGVYELEAIADNGISDNIVRVLQQEELTGGYTFSFRPTSTDNPGWSVYNDGELVDSADTFPVARGAWYSIKIEVLKSSLKVWINDVVLFETDSITPPSDIPGYFKVGVAYSGGFDNLKFTPDSSVCE